MHTSIYCHHSSQYWLLLQASSSLNLLEIALSSWNLLQGKMRSWFLDLFALALGLVWKYPALVVPVFDCALPSQSEDFTIQRQHQEQQLEIRTKQWSTTIELSKTQKGWDCSTALILFSQFTRTFSGQPLHSAPAEVALPVTVSSSPEPFHVPRLAAFLKQCSCSWIPPCATFSSPTT